MATAKYPIMPRLRIALKPHASRHYRARLILVNCESSRLQTKAMTPSRTCRWPITDVTNNVIVVVRKLANIGYRLIASALQHEIAARALLQLVAAGYSVWGDIDIPECRRVRAIIGIINDAVSLHVTDSSCAWNGPGLDAAYIAVGQADNYCSLIYTTGPEYVELTLINVIFTARQHSLLC